MSGKRENGAGDRENAASARRARLEQELRANLLKRKAQARARTASPKPCDEGGQGKA
jgi:hypothetical protein